MSNWYKIAKAPKTFDEIKKEYGHYKITCLKCGDLHQCRCISKMHTTDNHIVANVNSCPTCEDVIEASVSPSASSSPSQPMSTTSPTSEDSVSPQQIYTKNDVIQNRDDIAPSRLRKKRKQQQQQKDNS